MRGRRAVHARACDGRRKLERCDHAERREAFAGTVVEGGACLGDHECVDGLTCVGYTGSTDGHCQPPPAVGAACGAAPSDGGSSSITSTSFEFGTHPSCAAGAICVDHRCVTGTEKVPGPEGSDCASTGSDECAPGLYCEAKKCAPQKSAGAACTGGVFSSECAGRCDAPSSSAGTCKTFCGSR